MVKYGVVYNFEAIENKSIYFKDLDSGTAFTLSKRNPRGAYLKIKNPDEKYNGFNAICLEDGEVDTFDMNCPVFIADINLYYGLRGV
jgi:hypothetical protein